MAALPGGFAPITEPFVHWVLVQLHHGAAAAAVQLVQLHQGVAAGAVQLVQQHSDAAAAAAS